jgi:serine/threonine protein kinase
MPAQWNRTISIEYNVPMPQWLGRTLGKVNVELLLARGGMAEVYLGKHSTLQRAVVIKVINNQYADDPELLDRFQREARTIAFLRHPNIVQVYDFDSFEGHPYIIMEYVPGLSLSAYMRALHGQNQQMDLQEISRLLTALAGALQYAHERGVIHRDVKPGNILLTSPSSPVEAGKPLPDDVQPVLTDFGLVRFLNSSQQSAAGQIAGTPAYMSPEQARGDPVDPRSDIYSLGIVLYELLAGRIPFEADSTMGVLLKHMNEPPPPIAGLPKGLQKIIDRVLAKQPAERFQTPNELASAFQAAVESRTEAPTVPLRNMASPLTPPTNPAIGKQTWNWLSASALVGAIVLVVGFLTLRSFISSTKSSNPPSAYPTMDMSAAGTTAVPGSTSEQPSAVFRFQDGSARVDEVTLSASDMPMPPKGMQYEAWLVDESGEGLRSLGYLTLDEKGKGTLIFIDPQGRNLLAVYNKMEITVEPNPDPSPNPAGQVAYDYTLPPGGLLHVRHLLVSFPKAPNGAALVDGLSKDASLVDESAQHMLAAYQSGDQTATRLEAEAILNLLVGSQSEDHKDWDSDGKITDPGDGYGLLLNGDNSGYIQATYSHADFAVTAEDATANMKLHGEHVKISVKNLEQWTPQLRDLMKQILASPIGPDSGPAIRQAVALSDNLLKGTDLNGNEKIEPIPGEGGAQTAYQHAYYMADMVIIFQK